MAMGAEVVLVQRAAQAPQRSGKLCGCGALCGCRFRSGSPWRCGLRRIRLGKRHRLPVQRQRGLTPPVMLAGGGKAGAQRAARTLCTALGLDGQVHFLGHCGDVPGLLMGHRICVLATHFEGMPLSLIEGMAAGCAIVGSRVVGVQEIIDDGRNGLLAEHADPQSLADALERLLTHDDEAQRMAQAARDDAVRLYSLQTMTARYEDLLLQGLEAAP